MLRYIRKYGEYGFLKGIFFVVEVFEVSQRRISLMM